MKIVLTGGAASGKSAHAERILCQYTKPTERLYLATMQPFGQAAQKRIARHHALRKGKGFDTAECYRNLHQFQTQRPYQGILLECITNLLANEMFSERGMNADLAVQRIVDGIAQLEKQCKLLVIVTGEIFSDGENYSSETQQYCRQLGLLNQKLMQTADAAARSICGILLSYKGEHFL